MPSALSRLAALLRRLRRARPSSPPSGRPLALAPGSSLLVALPDTQIYSLHHPELFEAQTAWVAALAARHDVRFVVHLGDVVHTNTPEEWARAAAAMRRLDGVVPYAFAPGNHDYGPGGDASVRETPLGAYFSYDLLAAAPTFGGAFAPGRLDSTYHLFSAAGRDFLLLALEWAPRDEVLAWADGVMRAHPERLGILATHAYLNETDLRYDHTDRTHQQDYNPHLYRTAGGVNDGEEIWQKLVRHHRFVMTLNGHVLGRGVGYLASPTDRGTVCHQMLSNYQTRAQGGDGLLRIVELLADGRGVRVWTYSATRDLALDEPGQSLSFELPPR